MEDYEKKYKEALSRAATELETCGADKSLRNMIYAIFPDELKESKDETIRKEIIEFVDINTLSVDERHDRWIAWLEKQGQTFTKKDVDDAYLKGIIDAKNELEKQGEQKTADKVEPKFHKGEWIVWKNKCYKVNYNGCGYELIDQNGLSTSLEYGTVDENAHLWDITKDAKDGDVLISQYGNPLIYNGNYNSLNIGAYCGITCDDNKFKVAEEKCHWTENVDTKPSTKEQRDTLEKAMADAGYTFDFEKKELKKIEDEIEIPFGAKDSELQEATYYIPKGFHAEIDDDKVAIKKGEKSVAWSDEDEGIVLSIEQVIQCASSLNLVPEKLDKISKWLKSLKDRIGR